MKLEKAYEIPVWDTDTVSLTLMQTPSSDEDFVTDLKSSAGLLRLKPALWENSSKSLTDFER